MLLASELGGRGLDLGRNVAFVLDGMACAFQGIDYGQDRGSVLDLKLCACENEIKTGSRAKEGENVFLNYAHVAQGNTAIKAKPEGRRWLVEPGENYVRHVMLPFARCSPERRLYA